MVKKMVVRENKPDASAAMKKAARMTPRKDDKGAKKL